MTDLAQTPEAPSDAGGMLPTAVPETAKAPDTVDQSVVEQPQADETSPPPKEEGKRERGKKRQPSKETTAPEPSTREARITAGRIVESQDPTKEVRLTPKEQSDLFKELLAYNLNVEPRTATARERYIEKLCQAIEERQKTGSTELFRSETELVVALGVLEDRMIAETAVLGSVLVQDVPQGTRLDLPPEIQVTIGEPWYSELAQKAKGRTGGLSRLWGTLTRDTPVTFHTRPLDKPAEEQTAPKRQSVGERTSQLLDKVQIKGQTSQEAAQAVETAPPPPTIIRSVDSEKFPGGLLPKGFTSETTSSQRRLEILKRQQLIRLKIYQELGLDLRQADDLSLLDLSMDTATIETRLKFHNRTADHLRHLLRTEGAFALSDLPPQRQIELFLKAREQAAESLINEGEAETILKEIAAGQTRESTDLADLQEKIGSLRSGKKATDWEIQEQTIGIQKLTATVERTQAEIEQLTKIDSLTDPEGLSQVTDEAEVAEALYKAATKAYESQIDQFDKDTPKRTSRIQTLREEIDSLSSTIKKAAKGKDTKEQAEELRSKKEELKRLQKEEERRTQIEEYRKRLSELNEQRIRSAQKRDHLIRRRERLVESLGETMEERVERQQRLIAQLQNEQSNLTRMREGLPTEFDTEQADLLEKLRAVAVSDYNTIMERVLTGEKGANLLELSDPERAYDTILELLFHTNSNEESKTISRAQQERLLPRGEFARLIMAHYGLDYRDRPEFENIVLPRMEWERLRRETATIQSLRLHPTEAEDTFARFLDAKTDYLRSINQSGENMRTIFEEILPFILNGGRLQAAQLIQRVIESRVKDANLDLIYPNGGLRESVTARAPIPTGEGEETTGRARVVEPLPDIDLGDV